MSQPTSATDPIQMQTTMRAAVRLTGRSYAAAASSRCSENERDAKRQDYHVVEIAQHRDEIGDQVNGRNGISGNRDRQSFCIPTYADHGLLDKVHETSRLIARASPFMRL